MAAQEDLPYAGMFEHFYCILRVLGSGGEGKVYLVRHLPTDQLRAAKQLLGKKGEERMHELNMMKKLHHSSLPRVLDVLEEADCVWLILEYVRGVSLKKLAEQGMAAEQFFSILLQLSDVLCYLHHRSRPILHLDIKPSNLMVRSDGTLVLIDFGAALIADPDVKPARCSGTPGYAAPEQYESGHSLDGRTDLYGFGAVMYFLLFGERTDRKRQYRSPPHLHGWLGAGRMPQVKISGVSYRLVRRLLCHTLAAEMDKRYPDAGALSRAVEQVWKRYRRRRWRFRTGEACALLVVLSLFAGHALTAEHTAQTEKKETAYETLLQEAAGLGSAQAGKRYLQAVQLCPDDIRAYVQMLDQILEDGHFGAGEEETLWNMLSYVTPGGSQTAEERLARKQEAYGHLAYEIGIAYWYCYEEDGGRPAAARWFEKAVAALGTDEKETEMEWGEPGKAKQQGGAGSSGKPEVQGKSEEEGEADIQRKQCGEEATVQEESGGVEETDAPKEPDWAESARLHSKIAQYYGTIGRVVAGDDEPGVYWRLWKDLKLLWWSDGFQQEAARVRAQAAGELTACLIMQAGELKRNGEVEEEIECVLNDIIAFSEQAGLHEEAKMKLSGQAEAARDAVARAFANEKGGVEHDEKE